MYGNRNWNDIGNEIRDAVERSIQTGDFSEFTGAVTDTVSDVVDEARRQAKQGINGAATQHGSTSYSTKTTTFRTNGKTYEYQKQHWTNDNKEGPQLQHKHTPARSSFRPAKTILRRKGDVSGILLTVFGGIGTALTGVGFLVFGILALLLFGPAASIGGIAIFGLCMAGSIALIAAGTSARRRLERAERYLALCKNHDYVNLSELAAQTGKSERYVRKDVKKMLEIGMFPQGHLDRQESCLMLTDETYGQYLSIEKQRSVYELEEFSKAQSASVGAGAASSIEKNSEDVTDASEKAHYRSMSGIADPGEELKRTNPLLASMIEQGQECTGHIRAMNERIPGEVISNKLYVLEQVLKDIFNRVREHPEQVPKMKKFMDYYLPTTRKLVEAYEEFDSIPNPNEEIIQAKSELEKTLDTINASFAELLNQMYQTSVLDATTDAKVLESMLTRDGLAKDHAFVNKQEKG